MFGVVIHHLYIIILGTICLYYHTLRADTVVICNSHTNVTRTYRYIGSYNDIIITINIHEFGFKLYV